MSGERWTLYRLPGANWTLLADDMSLPSRAETVEVAPVNEHPQVGGAEAAELDRLRRATCAWLAGALEEGKAVTFGPAHADLFRSLSGVGPDAPITEADFLHKLLDEPSPEHSLDSEGEQLTMIALALKNQGIEDCTPEEGVGILICRVLEIRRERDEAEQSHPAISKEQRERLGQIANRVDIHAREISRSEPHTGRGLKADAALLRSLATEGEEPCNHNWVDPSNEVVDADGHKLCTNCGAVRSLEDQEGSE